MSTITEKKTPIGGWDGGMGMGIGGGGYGYGGSYQGGYGQPMMRGGFGGMRGGMGRGFGSVVNPMMMRGGFSPGMVRSDKHHALIPELLCSPLRKRLL